MYILFVKSFNLDGEDHLNKFGKYLYIAPNKTIQIIIIIIKYEFWFLLTAVIGCTKYSQVVSSFNYQQKLHLCAAKN